MLLTGVAGAISNYMKTGFSKHGSLFTQTAYADVAIFDTGGGGCGGCCGGACFPAGTPIDTPQGSKSIELIKSGDVVYGFDPATGIMGEYQVVNNTVHSWDEVETRSPLLEIRHAQGSLVLTANHKVFKADAVSSEIPFFIEAKSLKPGDHLVMKDSSLSDIQEIIEKGEYDKVYNFEVKDVHTYVASGVRVHNDS